MRGRRKNFLQSLHDASDNNEQVLAGYGGEFKEPLWQETDIHAVDAYGSSVQEQRAEEAVSDGASEVAKSEGTEGESSTRFVILSGNAEEEDMPVLADFDNAADDTDPGETKSCGDGSGHGDGNDDGSDGASSMSEERRASGGARWIYFVIIAACFIFAVAVSAYSFSASDGFADPYDTEGDSDTAYKGDATDSSSGDGGNALLANYTQNQKSVVSVVVEDGVEERRMSGFVVDSTGLVATLGDVGADASNVRVTFGDGVECTGEIVAENADIGLTLIKTPLRNTRGIVASDDSLALGEQVFAIGTLNDALPSSLCRGYVAYVDRRIELDVSDGKMLARTVQLGGFSDLAWEGCPIFDADGNAVACIMLCKDGQGFALSMSSVLDVALSLSRGEEASVAVIEQMVFSAPTLGIYASNARVDQTFGAEIVDFERSGSDASSKLKVGDLIVAVGDKAVPDVKTLSDVILACDRGESIEVYVLRDGHILSFFVTVA